MTNVHQLPGERLAGRCRCLPPTLNLSAAEDRQKPAAATCARPTSCRPCTPAGSCERSGAQATRPVMLERAHYEAVMRGHFGAAANEPHGRPAATAHPVPPDCTAFLAKKKGR